MLYCTSLATLPWILFAFISLFIFISQTAGPRQRQTRTGSDGEEEVGKGTRDTCSYQIRVGCESDLKKVPQPANWINSVATCVCQMWHLLPQPLHSLCSLKKPNIYWRANSQTLRHDKCPIEPPPPPSPHHPSNPLAETTRTTRTKTICETK